MKKFIPTLSLVLITGFSSAQIFSIPGTYNSTTGYNKLTTTSTNSYFGINTTTPKAMFDVHGGEIISTHGTYSDIDLSLSAIGQPSLIAHRWTGGSNYDNWIIGSWYEAATGISHLAMTVGRAATNVAPTIRAMTIRMDGSIGMGTDVTGTHKLAVNGSINATEIKITTAIPGPDYVFEKDYSLPSLGEIESYINKNKHLPEIPSAKEMEQNGIQLGEMNLLLLKKIEELTLYVIDQQKQITAQQKEIDALKKSK